MIHLWRCCLCEILIGWALAIAPKDYTPSSVQAVIDAIDASRSWSEH